MFAAIDAGSNTFRLLIGSIENGKILPQTYLRRICRLAGNYKNNQLDPESMDRALAVFSEFSQHCQHSGVDQIKAVGTAVFRQSDNGDDFAGHVNSSTGLQLTIIDGKEEARLTAAGVLSALKPMPKHALIIDIGGGSTEFILCIGTEVVWTESLPLGVVHLTEGIHTDERRSTEITRATSSVFNSVDVLCSQFNCISEELTLVGTAGTVTTLAALDMEMEKYDWRIVNNYRLQKKILKQWYDRLLPLNAPEREALPGMEKGRGDLIVAGLEIILSLIDKFNFEELTVSDFGLLEGVLLSWENT